MSCTYCLNLCEEAEAYPKRFGGNVQAMMSAFLYEAGFPYCQRLYIGSNFCVQRLLATPSSFYRTVLGLCRQFDMRATLALPIATQKNLGAVKERIDMIRSIFSEYLDEITVNDFGMLTYISNEMKLRCNLGRLFHRDLRDPRYPDLYKNEHVLDACTYDLQKLIDEQPNLACIELDPTAHTIRVKGMPNSLEVALHVPYCYISTSHLCEYAARDKEPQRAFRAECLCASECLDTLTCYRTDSDVSFLKCGKTIYYYNPQTNLQDAAHMRLIHTPYKTGS